MRFVPAVVMLAAIALATLLALNPGLRPTTVYACTGSVDDLTLDHFATIAAAIAIVDVTQVGGPDNETPPLPPGTPLRDGRGPGSVPDDFDFTGYRADAIVRRTLAGSVSGTIQIDAALRAYLEEVVRRWEAGERFAPCFFGGQPRYQPNTSYLVFLGWGDEGWGTIAAYPIAGSEIELAIGTEAAPLQRKHLILGNETYHRYFSSYSARNSGPGLTNLYGDLWFIEQRRVPLDAVIRAVTGLRTQRTVTPPSTGDGGLRCPVPSPGLAPPDLRLVYFEDP